MSSGVTHVTPLGAGFGKPIIPPGSSGPASSFMLLILSIE